MNRTLSAARARVLPSDDHVVELETKLDALREKAGLTKRATLDQASVDHFPRLFLPARAPLHAPRAPIVQSCQLASLLSSGRVQCTCLWGPGDVFLPNISSSWLTAALALCAPPAPHLPPPLRRRPRGRPGPRPARRAGAAAAQGALARRGAQPQVAQAPQDARAFPSLGRLPRQLALPPLHLCRPNHSLASPARTAHSLTVQTLCRLAPQRLPRLSPAPLTPASPQNPLPYPSSRPADPAQAHGCAEAGDQRLLRAAGRCRQRNSLFLSQPPSPL